MPAFEYKAQDEIGKVHSGVIVGDSPKHARSLLREKALTPLEIHEVREQQKATSTASASSFSFQRGMSRPQLAILTRQFATLLNAGLPLDEVLQALAEQADNEQAKRMMLAIRARMLEGTSLSQALAEFPKSFDALYCASVAAGEQSAKLGVVLERLADYCENSAGITQKIALALVYPALLILVALGVVAGLLTSVIPQITQVFVNSDRALPLSTQAVMALSGFLSKHGALILLALTAALIVFFWALRRVEFRTRWHQFLLRIPVLGTMQRELQAARFARTMAICGAASVPVLEALRIAKQVVSLLPMQAAVADIQTRVREGSTLAIAMKETRAFPKLLERLIGSGEKSGALDTMMDHAAELMEKQVQNRSSTLLALLEPATILIMGSVVLLIVLSVLQPIFDMNTLVRPR